MNNPISTWTATLLRDLDPTYVWEDIKAKTNLTPQPGPQTAFLNSAADITVYGGSAGGGKSFGLLLAPLQWSHVPGFGAVIFRRTTTQVRAEGGLWDASANIYPTLDANPREQQLDWKFPSGASVSFAHMEYEKNRLDWQGSQICLIGFDELTHFTWKQVSYMFSRNRSTCGVKPRIMATTNPDADSWVAGFISWWINQDTGFPIADRAGVLRWFVQFGDDLIWGESRDELISRYPELLPMSVTFIPATLEDNPALTTRDPSYRSKLMSLDRVERERLLNGNWKVRPVAGMYFRREWFGVVDQAPTDVFKVRFWDFAGSKVSTKNKDPDWTVGLLLGYKPPYFYVIDLVRMQDSPGAVEERLLRTAEIDGKCVPVFVEQEPGSSSLYLINSLIDRLPGYIVTGIPSTGSKQTRAKPVSSAAEHGKIFLVRGEWNTSFLSELEYFPEGAHDDQVDGLSGSHAALVELWKLLTAETPDNDIVYGNTSVPGISPV